jgi:serine/threonine protein kinase
MLKAGDCIGNYRLVDILGSGTFGRVYLAKHQWLAQAPQVAIKILHADDPKARNELLREIRFLEQLEHRAILSIRDAGVDDDMLYIVTEYAPNDTLRTYIQRLAGRPATLEEAQRIIFPIGEALQYAHEKRIVHRDLKPANILFNAQNEPLLADFGAATVLNSLGVKKSQVLGTPAYMAPEQFSGNVSAKSDQYALGCTLYELLTGQKPFTNPSIEALWHQHAHVSPIPPRQLNPTLPEYNEVAILKAMAKKPSDRHKDVKALREGLSTPPQTPQVSQPEPTVRKGPELLTAPL